MLPLFFSLNVLTSHLKAVIKWNTWKKIKNKKIKKTSTSAAEIKGLNRLETNGKWGESQSPSAAAVTLHDPSWWCTYFSLFTFLFLSFFFFFFCPQKNNSRQNRQKAGTETKITRGAGACSCRVARGVERFTSRRARNSRRSLKS